MVPRNSWNLNGLSQKNKKRGTAVGFVLLAVRANWVKSGYPLLRGTLLNRTYGLYKNLYISLFLLTIFGPVYYDPCISDAYKYSAVLAFVVALAFHDNRVISFVNGYEMPR